jgi:HAD superfamily hydrolase (TIGR01509 family)
MTAGAASPRSRAEPPRWGALFDWDGVLVDSKALHQAAWDQVAREFGHAHGPADFGRHFGTQNRRAILEILRWTEDEAEAGRISVRKELIYRELLGVENIWMSAALAFVDLLGARGVPRAVVSSSPRQNIEVVLQRAAPALDFASIVTAEDTRQGKPHPEGFLLGAERLGLPPERCVVFEDAPAGILAGLAAGMRVVALTTTHEAAELARADLVTGGLVPTLLTRIEAWFRA